MTYRLIWFSKKAFRVCLLEQKSICYQLIPSPSFLIKKKSLGKLEISFDMEYSQYHNLLQFHGCLSYHLLYFKLFEGRKC